MSTGTIIIAAHNEESVLGRTLDALMEVVTNGMLTVIVVCNGCTDRTAETARRYPGVIVIELSEASKILALRAGDRLAGPGPRIYLDADVVLTSRAAQDLCMALDTGAIAGRPPHVFDTTGASLIVRRWYSIRSDLPSISSALWGAGCYGISGVGRTRFNEFPDLVSDDLFVDSQFARGEIEIVDAEPLTVTTPRRVGDLIRILSRSYRTQTEVVRRGQGLSRGQRGQLKDLLKLALRSPRRIPDVILYITIIIYSRARIALTNSTDRWERDVSSREISNSK